MSEISPEEMTDRIFETLTNLMASVEDFYESPAVEEMEPEDRIAVLHARWLIATMNDDQEYLSQHTWDDALLP